jgi:hypothetical protein
MPSASDNGQQVTTQLTSQAILTALKTTPQIYYEPTLHLNVANVTVTPETALGGLTEATFTGYAAVASVAFGTPGNGPNGSAEMFAPSVTFTCTGGTPNQTVYGWYLTDSGATTLYLYVPLAVPVQITTTGDQVTVQPAIQNSGT